MTKIKNFYNSYLYLIFVGLASFVFWAVNAKEWGIITLFLIGVLSLYFVDDFKNLLATVVIAVMSIRSQSQSRLIIISVIGLALLFFVISTYIFVKRTNILQGKFNFGALWQGIAIAVFVAILGGLPTPYISFLHNFKILVKVGAIFLAYLLFINFLYKDSREFFAKALVVGSFIIIFEVLYTYTISGNFWQAALLKEALLGWGNHNSIALLLTMSLPMCIYLALKNIKYKYVFIAFLCIFALAVFLLFSRSNMLTITIILPILLIYYIKTVPKECKMRAIISTSILLVIFLVSSVFLLNKINDDIWKLIFERADSGRFALYKQAFIEFKNHPIFGTGLYLDKAADIVANWQTGIYMYHSAPMTILACFGIVGVIGFIPLYFQRYKLILTRAFKLHNKKVKVKSNFGFLALLSVFAFAVYSTIDVGLVHFFLNLYLFLFLGLTECKKEH